MREPEVVVSVEALVAFNAILENPASAVKKIADLLARPTVFEN